MTDEETLNFARGVVEAEAAAVRRVVAAVDEAFLRAVRMLLNCPASVLVSGIGKAGHVARKLAATFASTGTPAHFLSPADAAHGDLGSVRHGDVVLLLSASGESEEILTILNIVKKLGHPVVAVTSAATNSLAKHADVAIVTGKIEEACPLKLAPSASTTAMMALGDALALSVMQLRNFTADDFAVFHPAGQLGRRLIKVREAMSFKLGENLPVASDRLTVGQVLHEVARIKRRSGAVILVDDATNKLSGIFTDGDLRRLITNSPTDALSKPVREVMTPNPRHIAGDALASEAIAVMHTGRVDELPVINESGEPIGLIDVQDLVVLKMLEA
jgi:arabinose-5-phosphate isomerase